MQITLEHICDLKKKLDILENEIKDRDIYEEKQNWILTNSINQRIRNDLYNINICIDDWLRKE